MFGRGRSGDGVPDRGAEPDYRFTLANERTFLAWIRTSLALLAGAVAVLHLIPLGWGPAPRLTVGLSLAAVAITIAAYAPVRWMRVQGAMRMARPLPTSVLPLITAVAVVAVSLVVVLGNLLW